MDSISVHYRARNKLHAREFVMSNHSISLIFAGMMKQSFLSLIFLSSLFLSPSGFAKDTGEIQIPAPNLDEVATQKLAQDVMTEVDSWLGDLQKPEGVELAQACESFISNQGKYDLLYVPATHLIHYQGAQNYPTQYHSVVFAHEYAHTVFRANKALISSYLHDDMETSLELRQAWRRVAKTEPVRTPGVYRCTLMTDPTSELEHLLKKLTANAFFSYHAALLTAYDELLADIFTVFYTGQGDAMYKTLGGDTVNWLDKYDLKSPQDFRGRDFTYQLSVDQWFGNDVSFSFINYVNLLRDGYVVLDPVRSYLWENYLQGLPKEKFSAFIKAYLIATGVEFNRYYEANAEKQPVREMNERFIKLLDEQLAIQGISKIK